MEYTDDLDNYKSLSPTESCYLDGRYFNKVFHKYPGLIKEPLTITLKETDEGIEDVVFMRPTDINNKYIGLLRVIIQDGKTRHSNLVIIDYLGQKIYRFEPLGLNSPYFNEIGQLIEDYLDQYIDFDMEVIDVNKLDEKNPDCDKGGFCLAYVTKFAYDYLNGRVYDPSDIRRFAQLVEQKYGLLPEAGKDVEYGILDGNVSTRNVLITGLGGAILGGALGGTAQSALIGGVAGAGLGLLFL